LQEAARNDFMTVLASALRDYRTTQGRRAALLCSERISHYCTKITGLDWEMLSMVHSIDWSPAVGEKGGTVLSAVIGRLGTSAFRWPNACELCFGRYVHRSLSPTSSRTKESHSRRTLSPVHFHLCTGHCASSSGRTCQRTR
jgi:hypothetical protein